MILLNWILLNSSQRGTQQPHATATQESHTKKHAAYDEAPDYQWQIISNSLSLFLPWKQISNLYPSFTPINCSSRSVASVNDLSVFNASLHGFCSPRKRRYFLAVPLSRTTNVHVFHKGLRKKKKKKDTNTTFLFACACLCLSSCCSQHENVWDERMNGHWT